VETVDLIRRAQAGDQEALGQLLAAHREELVRLAAERLDPRLRGRLDASDIVQQTCLSVFQRIAGFQGSEPAQFAAWLRQVHEHNIQNAVRDQVQTQKRSAGSEVPLSGDDLGASRQATASRHAMQREDAARLEAALGQLPADQRDALHLRYFEDCTLGEVAEQLGLTKDAVVWLLQKGMKRVRQLLAEPAHPPP
jgi:RNA polymerase sigma-70 factor (ECF subfamily)